MLSGLLLSFGGLLLFGLPIFAALAFAVVVAVGFWGPFDPVIVPMRMFAGMNNFSLMAIPFFILASRVFQKLLQTHSVVHIHPNNCCGSIKGGGLEIPRVAEFTFHRNDRLGGKSYRQNFPHPLDCDNTQKRPLVLPQCWYRKS